uniref:ATP synthase epsilon chain, chloroplastic n=2 Tax=Ulva TaxID=3118 RepID=A0A8K1W5Z7_9CHLO|nr:ATP synthase epsilon chain [Ulva flexuosa]YP_010530107.1 ATP synthase CF1 subunit epsilon [Ulva torta]YP_010835495.1 ATP synthase CF1 subunit epsilon [Ulva aragoensis]UEN67776.1 ATP synthase CF1 epsilon subunit [Ulva californica]ARO34748.1 ATP synthase epsilon chain [Ulva flexuosa]UFQ87331.1 ATP synthase CF1 epsilon subunit [Ulva torta]UXW92205.1 ATP synthase CF1 subunit epsilon [Ulva torta]WFS79963.1 ATP synthase CF1 subunit epsilon [Ulva aragoensis]
MSLQVCIMTPDKIFWDEEAEEIILPTNTGQMGVLPKHAPLITALDIGVMSIRQDNSWNSFALMNGFASIQNDKVTILVNSAESKQTIDRNEAEKEFLEAQERVNKTIDEKEKVEAVLAFKRSRARFLVIKD